MKKNRKPMIVLIGLLVLLAASCLLSVAIGARFIPFEDVVTWLFGGETAPYEAAVIDSRIPRTLFGLLAGAALGVSGTLMQAITRNPISDPGILGINSGAALFVVCGMSFFHITSSQAYMTLAFLGAGITAVGVYSLASFGGSGPSPIKLALAGAAAGTALAALVNAVILPNASAMDKFRFWQVGSLGGADWGDISAILPVLIIGFVLALIMAPYLNILALGDEMATGLGIKINLVRGLSALAGVLLCASVTALAGPIGFVGLMVPHLVRLFVGADLRWIMPLSALAGSCLLLVSDVIGRVAGGAGEIEVGIITALLGAPFFIFVVRRSKVSAL